MSSRASLNPVSADGSEGKLWAAFGDVALAMLLVFVLFILAQFVHYERFFVLEQIEMRMEQVKLQIETNTDAAAGRIEVIREDDLHQRIRVAGQLVFAPCRWQVRTSGQELLQQLGLVLSAHESFFESIEVEGTPIPYRRVTSARTEGFRTTGSCQPAAPLLSSGYSPARRCCRTRS